MGFRIAAGTTAYARNEVRIQPEKVDNTLRPMLKGQIHDALWMLTQQWRMGEFIAEDAGTPVEVRFKMQTSQVDVFKSRIGIESEYNNSIPLETQVERLPIPFTIGISMLMSRKLLKLLNRHTPTNTHSYFIQNYPLNPDEYCLSNSTDAEIVNSLSSRLFDGAGVYQDLKGGTLTAAAIVPPGEETAYSDNVLTAFITWFESTYSIPSAGQNNWSTEQLEYKATIATTGGNTGQKIVLEAPEYNSGHLDWHSFDKGDSSAISTTSSSTEITKNTLIAKVPAPLRFKGMPNSRWWEFEDRNIDIANIRTQQKDILKISMMEFALTYSNDWFVVPVEVKIATLSRIDVLVVKDVFNIKTAVKPAGNNNEASWHNWNLFKFSERANMENVDSATFFLAPVLTQLQESEAFEKVQFLKDEMANMVWAIEKVVPGNFGEGISGHEAWSNLGRYKIANLNITVPRTYIKPNHSRDAYELMTSFPENWIPFIPVKLGDSTDSQIRYQRATYKRVLNTEPPLNTDENVVPRTNLLRPDNNKLFINEEEILRQGLELTTTFQRARWHDGSTHLWLGRKKRTGFGEGSSGLRFDKLSDKKDYSEMPGVSIDVNSLTFAEINGELLNLTYTSLDNSYIESFRDLFLVTLDWPNTFSASGDHVNTAIAANDKYRDVLYQYDPTNELNANGGALYTSGIVPYFPGHKMGHTMLRLNGKATLLEDLYANDPDNFIKHGYNFNKSAYLTELANVNLTTFDSLYNTLIGEPYADLASAVLILLAVSGTDVEDTLAASVSQATNTSILSSYEVNDTVDIPQESQLVILLGEYPTINQTLNTLYGSTVIIPEIVSLYSELVWDTIINQTLDKGQSYLDTYLASSLTDFLSKSLFASPMLADTVLEEWLLIPGNTKTFYTNKIGDAYTLEIQTKLLDELKKRFL